MACGLYKGWRKLHNWDESDLSDESNMALISYDSDTDENIENDEYSS